MSSAPSWLFYVLLALAAIGMSTALIWNEPVMPTRRKILVSLLCATLMVSAGWAAQAQRNILGFYILSPGHVANIALFSDIGNGSALARGPVVCSLAALMAWFGACLASFIAAELLDSALARLTGRRTGAANDE